MENELRYCKDIKVKTDSTKSINLFEIIKFDTIYVDLAWLLAKNNGDIIIRLHSHERLLDTAICYHLNVNYKKLNQDCVIVHKGICAKVDDYDGYRKYERLIVDYFEERQLSYNDSIVDLVKCYLVELNKHSKYGFKELYVSEEIPIVSSLKGMEYRISSNLKADYYYLFACKEADEIRDFVKEVKLLDFKGANSSLNNNIPCYMTRSSSGNLCIVLIGINNDFSYKTIPVGIICVDNVPPIVDCDSFGRKIGKIGKNEKLYKRTFYIFNNKIITNDVIVSSAMNNTSPNNSFKTTLTEEESLLTQDNALLMDMYELYPHIIEGGTRVTYSEFYNSNVPFFFECHGDISKIVFNNNIVINCSGGGIITKTIHLNLDYGDNFIPIKVVDKRGNENSGSINIRTKRSPDLVIENYVH